MARARHAQGEEGPATPKGARQADAIVDATLRCLARDGYAATSLQRVADEAGVQKRMVVYYFGSRTGLMTSVVDQLGERFLGQLEQTLRGLEDPATVLTAGLNRIWGRLTEDRALQIAYFGLVAESVADPEIQTSLAALRDRGRQLAESLLDDLVAAGYELQMDRGTFLMLAEAAVHGLGVELIARGDSPELQRAVSLAELAVQFVFERS